MSDSENTIELLKTMVLIREFESRVEGLFEDDELPGFVHLYIGQEAVATGACSVIRDDDYLTSTHRGHGHCIAKGLNPDKMMAELYAKETGYCKGRGGSMHIADINHGMLGANGIVGAGTGIGAGAGLTINQQNSDNVCLTFFGDGAMAEGLLYESMNLAVVQNLPVVYICENNMYGELTPAEKQHDVSTFEKRGPAFGMPGERIDGMDVIEVKEHVEEAVDRARNGEGPSLLVCDTYRFKGHYVGDPVEYRTEEEEEEWRRRDPIDAFETKLIEEGQLTEEEFESIREDAVQRIDEAVEYGRESDAPDPEDAYYYVYAEEL